MTVSAATLAIFRSVRTSDVTDALDSLGQQVIHEMDPAMRPLFPGIHFAGLAHTQEYGPIDAPLTEMPYEEFDRRQYAKDGTGFWQSAGPWGAPDEVLVIDAKRTRAGIIGSNNVLAGMVKGTVGYVIDGTCRDSGECILQKVPAFSTVRSPAHPMGRIAAISNNQPIVCGGVRVNSGDVVIADDDGVVVVPQALADEVARRAKLIQDKDRPGRRSHYEALGMPLDDTVR
jgi:regulator of RNase E activity RraA